MAEFVLKINYCEFDSKVKRQISDTAIGTKFAPPYVCIFMDKVEGEFLGQEIWVWVWLRYIDGTFLFGEKTKINLKGFYKV